MRAIKDTLKQIPIIGGFAMHAYILYKNIFFYARDEHLKASYFRQIEQIKRDKEIILDIDYGGLGDVLAFTSLPRLLKEQLGISFYLSSNSLGKFRHPDIFKLCFETNPFFAGIKEPGPGQRSFTYKGFSSELSPMTFLTGRGHDDVVSSIERQFGLKGTGRPEVFYAPKHLAEYENVILVDKNYVSGKKMGWKYSDAAFQKEMQLHEQDGGGRVEYVDPAKQSLFDYLDMIHSCRHFITVLSGGAALAAAFPKPFTVILPYNTFGGAVDQFVFRKSSGRYIL